MRWPIVCFDLDGTLCDTREGIVASLRHTMQQLGLPHPGGELQRFIGPPLHEIYSEGFGVAPDAVQGAVDAYREFYVAGAMFLNRPYPGIVELVQGLRAQGARLAVCTAKPWIYATQILERHELAQHFEIISGPELDGTRRHKPEIIAHALERMGATPGPQVLMIGDRHYDIEGAHALGAQAAAALWGFGSEAELRGAGPQHVCQDTQALAQLLEI